MADRHRVATIADTDGFDRVDYTAFMPVHGNGKDNTMADIAIGLHGGCGTLEQGQQGAAEWAQSRGHMADALRAGWSVLRGGVAALTEAGEHGTVGAVARDANGHLAAATSTDGFNNKPEGRVGDSPIIGAGTYACDGVCAVSCTGQGEIFIRRVAARTTSQRACNMPARRSTQRHMPWCLPSCPAMPSVPVWWRPTRNCILWGRREWLV